MLEIEELIQALTVAYEPPTLAELAVLTQIDDLRRLSDLVQRCSPILQIRPDDTIAFTEPEFRERLSGVFLGHPDPPSAARKRYHSLMALRCFKYIKTSYVVPAEDDYASEAIVDLRRGNPASLIPITTSLDNNGDVLLVAPDDDVSRIADSSVSVASVIKCAYPVRYLFEHLSEGFPDAVQELFEHDLEFWGGQSTTRDRWLEDFQSRTTHFKDLNTSGMSTLHVAAGIGAIDLVSILIDRNGKESSSWTNTDGMTAVGTFSSQATAQLLTASATCRRFQQSLRCRRYPDPCRC
jgi:hypothetical protein